jgi:hypothetical protein
MQHLDKNTYNIRLKTQMKHWEQTFVPYLYNHCNICNIPIYFCNIHIKHLQHISEISETLATCACNMRFQHNITFLLRRMELIVAELDTSSSSVRQRSGEHCAGEHHLREAMSTPGEQEGRGEYLRLAQHGPTRVRRAHTVQGREPQLYREAM